MSTDDLPEQAPWFQQCVLQWYEAAGRKHLPWQQQPTPYRVWLSEIMLQQTQVATVIPYFERFTRIFPDLPALAAAPVDEVLALWSGLGYYARARNLHKTAQRIAQDFDGVFPADIDVLMRLPGIGRSTAGAIMSLAMQQAAPILDGNVKRVLSRFFALEGAAGSVALDKKLWALSTQLTPVQNCRPYNQAMMDIGATLCTRARARCDDCPLKPRCLALAQQRVYALPQPRKRKCLPVRCCQMLVIWNERNEVFMEKRPNEGVWGGLWSLPQLSSELLAEECCIERWQFKAERVADGAVFRHTFSHFHLDIQPVFLRIKETPLVIAENNPGRWVTLAELNYLGLATPVTKILQHYAQQTSLSTSAP